MFFRKFTEGCTYQIVMPARQDPFGRGCIAIFAGRLLANLARYSTVFVSISPARPSERGYFLPVLFTL